MDIFGNSKNPFYRFGQMMTLKKIAKEYWKPFIHDSFYNHGKSISDDMIERICNATPGTCSNSAFSSGHVRQQR